MSSLYVPFAFLVEGSFVATNHHDLGGVAAGLIMVTVASRTVAISHRLRNELGSGCAESVQFSCQDTRKAQQIQKIRRNYLTYTEK